VCQHPYVRWRPVIVALETGEAATSGAVLLCADRMCSQVIASVDGDPPFGPHVALEMGQDGQYHPYHGRPEWIF
jgi:hypothetical protein